ncbi:MAG: D-glycero-beta-D-manno-heptose 1,7-bisphosphate 7-phosphatase [Betaproteobacteria bacterium]|nr:D-glycero-beta-D-manno-heptose 1,7-bisphosphate 7-phosphatase [Betaproteobacteria bacterium]
MKLVILDRDGTINADRDDYVKSSAEWLPLPGALEAIARLNQAGWHVVVATNQSGIGRGLFDMETLNAMHSKMHSLLAAVGGRVDAVFFCPHTPADACDCRKPAAGLFHRIGERYGIDLRFWESVCRFWGPSICPRVKARAWCCWSSTSPRWRLFCCPR